MDDRELDELLDDASRHWRVPVDPPLERIWEAVAAERFARRHRSPQWLTMAIAAMVALTVGVLGGRWSVRSPASARPTIVAATPDPLIVEHAGDIPDQRAMGELLGRTAVLLAALPPDSASASIDPQIAREGARLLATTRVLLDSRLGADTKLHNLLQDLELVLAQVARIEPRHRANDMEFIQTALDEHDIVPRLRSAAADLSLDEF